MMPQLLPKSSLLLRQVKLSKIFEINILLNFPLKSMLDIDNVVQTLFTVIQNAVLNSFKGVPST